MLVKALKKLYSKITGKISTRYMAVKIIEDLADDFPATLPAHTASDAGKNLAVKSNGTLEWTATLPAHTASDAGKVLAVKSDGTLEWISLEEPDPGPD